MTPPQATLHSGFEHVPSDGSGRFYAGADELFEHTGMLDAHWQAHTATSLFHRDLLDRLLPMTIDTVGELEQRVTATANAMLDHWQNRFGRNSPDGPLRFFVDLEERQLGREPYVDPDYGDATQEMMILLCKTLERCGRQRGWNVLASMYRPIRQIGLVHARESWTTQGPGEAFEAIWGGQAVKRLLNQRVLWAHLFYSSQDPRRLRGATHQRYAHRQARYTMRQLHTVDANPKEIWWAVWLEDEVRAESMRDIFRGLREALEGSEAEQLDATHHVLVCGAWKLLQDLTDEPVEPVLGIDGRHARPLRLSIPSHKTGPLIAEAWNADVVEPFWEVFGEKVEVRRAATQNGNG